MKLKQKNNVHITVLMLVAGLLYLWVRSASTSDVLLLFLHQGRMQAITSSNGVITVILSDLSFGQEQSYTAILAHKEDDSSPPESYWRAPALEFLSRDAERRGAMGIAYGRDDFFMYVTDTSATFISAPHWFPLVLLVMGWLLVLLCRQCLTRRVRPGYCRCGYDLRASPERCPECGTSVPTAAAAGVTSPTSSVPARRVEG